MKKVERSVYSCGFCSSFKVDDASIGEINERGNGFLLGRPLADERARDRRRQSGWWTKSPIGAIVCWTQSVPSA
jgi:hypothetical protein